MSEEKDIPKHWQYKKLGEVCDKITKGGTPTTYGFAFVSSGINFIKVENIEHGKVNLSSIRTFITDEAHNYQKKSILEENDLLFSIAGTIGETCLIKQEYLPANTNQALAILRGYYKEVQPQFLTYQLSSSISQYVKSKARGGAMNNISLEDLKGIDLVVPPLPEQQAIISKIEELLSDLENGKQQLQTAQQQLKVYRQAVLKWAFEGRLTHENVKDGELPVGWKFKKHYEIANINPKLPFEKIEDDTEVSFLPMKLVEEEKNKFQLTAFKKYKEVKKGFTPFTNGDVIFAKITPCMENGKCAVLHGLKNKIGFGSTEFQVSRPKENVIPEYIFYFIIQESFRRNAAKNMTGSVGQKRVPTPLFSNFEIPIPPTKEEQKLIVQEIETRLSVCDKLEETITHSLQQSEALRQSILKKAFEGKLVAQNPKDEPASKMLERVKAESTKNEVEKKKSRRDVIIIG